ncbi:MAG: DUF2891 domain-containing protein [Xanthomonadaceae bacterium]|nr:DUF2891 domain-containing protein [Xanthomonadaceae bacterium]
MTALNPARASQFARIALGHVGREYPYKLGQVLSGDADLAPPRQLHPIFHGSFDWHSCVHGHWTLATLLRRYPALPEAAAIRARFDAMFSAANVAGERAFFAQAANRGFERPYGWAWLLMLQAELHRHDTGWAARLQPLAEDLATRFREFLPRATYPVRVGSHFNTAFALVLAQEYAQTVEAPALTAVLGDAAQRWHADDRDAQAWEPSGDDFLSSTLTEALAMQRLLPAAAFSRWFEAFLPRLAVGAPRTLFEPAMVSDRSDGKIAHLDGLNLSRAWCWRALAAALPAGDPRIAVMQAAADRHLAASLPAVAGDYMGEHWLASFALLALRD